MGIRKVVAKFANNKFGKYTQNIYISYMKTSMKHLRFKDEVIEDVENLAIKENRTKNNMYETLIIEALNTRKNG